MNEFYVSIIISTYFRLIIYHDLLETNIVCNFVQYIIFNRAYSIPMRYGVVLLNFKWAQKTLAATLTVINDCTHIQVLLDKSGAQIANCDYDSDQISSRVQSASALFLVNRTYVTSCCGSRRCEAEAHKQSFLECAFNEGCWHCGWWSSFRSVPVGTNVALCSTRERERERE